MKWSTEFEAHNKIVRFWPCLYQYFLLKVPLIERAVTEKVILGLVLGVRGWEGLVSRREEHPILFWLCASAGTRARLPAG